MLGDSGEPAGSFGRSDSNLCNGSGQQAQLHLHTYPMRVFVSFYVKFAWKFQSSFHFPENRRERQADVEFYVNHNMQNMKFNQNGNKIWFNVNQYSWIDMVNICLLKSAFLFRVNTISIQKPFT